MTDEMINQILGVFVVGYIVIMLLKILWDLWKDN